MKKINEAESRKLDAGMVLTGILAKNAGNYPWGYKYYGYCPSHKEGVCENMQIRLELFQLKHRICRL